MTALPSSLEFAPSTPDTLADGFGPDIHHFPETVLAADTRRPLRADGELVIGETGERFDATIRIPAELRDPRLIINIGGIGIVKALSDRFCDSLQAEGIANVNFHPRPNNPHHAVEQLRNPRLMYRRMIDAALDQSFALLTDDASSDARLAVLQASTKGLVANSMNGRSSSEAALLRDDVSLVLYAATIGDVAPSRPRKVVRAAVEVATDIVPNILFRRFGYTTELAMALGKYAFGQPLQTVGELVDCTGCDNRKEKIALDSRNIQQGFINPDNDAFSNLQDVLPEIARVASGIEVVEGARHCLLQTQPERSAKIAADLICALPSKLSV